ncbi:MAG: D-glycerate dehydrogenase [Planctomycetes bacterium]|nr:D-glycerate dehydrogenase [Planctomycetota bacterium]
MSFHVYVTRRIAEPGMKRLEQAGVSLEVNPEDRALARAELLAKVRGCDGVLCQLTDAIDEEVLDAAPQVRVFANYAVGYNNIDVAACRRRGIVVTHTPGVLTDATAEMAWALLFAAARRVAESDRFVRAGCWTGWGPMQFLGTELAGATLGVVGAGRIGTAFALKSRGFGMRVLYADREASEPLERELGARRVALGALLRESDFLSLHVPLTPETRHLIGRAELEAMKPTAILVNTSRGPVIDEAALVTALREGRIGGAGLDVYENEPELMPGLTELPNAVLCPHTGSATVAARSRMAELAATDLIRVLRGEEPLHPVP